VSDEPLDLDKHRGMAAKKTTDIRRVLADVENNARDLRDRQGGARKPTSVGSGCFPAGGGRQGTLHLLNFYATGLAPTDTRHRDLVAAVFADFARLSKES
jgi:hypothetical protein